MRLNLFGRHDRVDGKKGYEIVTPTTMGFKEADGTDVRLMRVREYDSNGNAEKTYMRDPMGVPFGDLPDVKDDPSFIEKLIGLINPQARK